MRTAVILAGGKGSRMESLGLSVPKPLIPIGGRPVIGHQLQLLKEHNVSEVFLLVYHEAESIEAYASEWNTDGFRVECIREESPLGTAGCLTALKQRISDDFFVLYGDVMVNMDLRALSDVHQKHRAVATLVTHPNDHPYDSDLVKVDSDNRIVELLTKKNRPSDLNYENRVNAALYVFSPKIFKYLKNEKTDLFHDTFPRLLKANESLFGYQTFEYLKDMGTPDRYDLVNRQFESGYIRRRNRTLKQKAVFLDRDGTLNRYDGLISSPGQLHLIDGVAEAVKALNRSDYLAIVVTNQPVVARNQVSFEELDEIHRRLHTLLGNEGAYLDGLYFCPHHPDSGYPEERRELKIRCQCRKPATGMVEKAERDFHLDLSQCWMVGDTTSDLQMAKTAGLKAALVRTGQAGRDGKYAVEPDYAFSSLLDFSSQTI